jgi:hypothetical protein
MKLFNKQTNTEEVKPVKIRDEQGRIYLDQVNMIETKVLEIMKKRDSAEDQMEQLKTELQEMSETGTNVRARKRQIESEMESLATVVKLNVAACAKHYLDRPGFGMGIKSAKREFDIEMRRVKEYQTFVKSGQTSIEEIHSFLADMGITSHYIEAELKRMSISQME